MELDTETKRNIRSEELLKQLSITNREIADTLTVEPDKTIDWDKVDDVLNQSRAKAKEYLYSFNDVDAPN